MVEVHLECPQSSTSARNSLVPKALASVGAQRNAKTGCSNPKNFHHLYLRQPLPPDNSRAQWRLHLPSLHLPQSRSSAHPVSNSHCNSPLSNPFFALLLHSGSVRRMYSACATFALFWCTLYNSWYTVITVEIENYLKKAVFTSQRRHFFRASTPLKSRQLAP